MSSKYGNPTQPVHYRNYKEPLKQQKGDWNETLKDMREQTKFSSKETYDNGLKKELNILQSKSLLERMKARFK